MSKSENPPYRPAQSEVEARRWSTLAQAQPDALDKWITDDAVIVRDLTFVLRTSHSSLDPYSRTTIERMRDKYEREQVFLLAVLDGKVSPAGRVLRGF